MPSVNIIVVTNVSFHWKTFQTHSDFQSCCTLKGYRTDISPVLLSIAFSDLDRAGPPWEGWGSLMEGPSYEHQLLLSKCSRDSWEISLYSGAPEVSWGDLPPDTQGPAPTVTVKQSLVTALCTWWQLLPEACRRVTVCKVLDVNLVLLACA